MYKVNLESQNRDQNDAVLARSLSQTDQSTLVGAPRPQSSQGQEIFSAVAETLLGNEDGDGLDAILIEADGAVYNGYYDQLDLRIDELLYSIVDDIEDAISRQFLRNLKFSAEDLEWVSAGKLNETLTSQAAVGLPSLLDADAFRNLMGKLRDRLPQFVGEALRWHIDTTELTKFLSAEIERFSAQEILPQVARNICGAEVAMSEHVLTASVDTLSGAHGHG
jgi:hypothetical protein